MKKTMLIVLDGWGEAPNTKGNAIARAKPHYFNSLKKTYSSCELNASGKQVGLLAGSMGNSEVGHLHIGAGRLVVQDLARIHKSISDKSFFKNKVLLRAMKRAKKKALHLIGLVSDAGVHAHIKHSLALIEMAKKQGVKKIYLHAMLDGRDMPPKSASKILKRIEKAGAIIATVQGRYYGMDRDNRWNRQKKAYDAMVAGKGRKASSWEDAIKTAYKKGETDEFVKPTVIDEKGTVKEGDTAIYFNFRSDRARELTRAFIEKGFKKFKRRKLKDILFVTLTQYSKDFHTPVAFPPEKLKNTLGEVLSKENIKQYRLAETEKWAHVTYFFNGLSDKKFKGEERLLIPSPKVSTYDKKPEMSAYKIARAAKKALGTGKFGLILINFANADMVGHNGSIQDTIKAVRVVDKCLSEIVPIARQKGYTVIITADHGNAEEKLYPDGSPCTAHSTNKVPLILVDKARLKFKKGSLYNIAPTILKLMGIKKPKEMSAKPLL